MKAIQIKYMGPTNTKGARWKVWAIDNKAQYYNRDYALNHDNDAIQCATAYENSLGWFNPMVFGTLPNGDYVAVLK